MRMKLYERIFSIILISSSIHQLFKSCCCLLVVSSFVTLSNLQNIYVIQLRVASVEEKKRIKVGGRGLVGDCWYAVCVHLLCGGGGGVKCVMGGAQLLGEKVVSVRRERERDRKRDLELSSASGLCFQGWICGRRQKGGFCRCVTCCHPKWTFATVYILIGSRDYYVLIYIGNGCTPWVAIFFCLFKDWR